MTKNKTILTKEDLTKLYLEDNLTVVEIAAQLEVGTATINRYLKKFDIKKSEEQRRAAISKTKQAKTEEEKQEYSKHISEARRGKGLGQIPWNKGVKGAQVAWNKGMKMDNDFYKKVAEGLANLSAEAKQQQKDRISQALHGRTPVNKGVAMSEEQKQKLRAAWGKLTKEEQQEIIQKQYNTKCLNKTCNTSEPEEQYYDLLCEKFPKEQVVRQYSTDARYPFACDFYVKSADLFIELNFHWSHGGHPFDNNNEADRLKLEFWKEKAKTSKFYQTAIETWTVRDVRKINTAKENNLNYLVFYNEEEVIDYEFKD